MGLLDDAIREHLDLKRRRGADPSELAREEADALGPVRREAEEHDEIDDLAAADRSSADHEPAGLDEPAAAYDDEPFVDDGGPVASEAPRTHDHAYAEPEDESATPPHGDPLAHQQTREFSATELGDALGHEDEPGLDAPAAPAPAPAADVVPADDEGDDEDDVLEETPDFLQETPEHDRLWFEQKPPKDFDF